MLLALWILFIIYSVFLAPGDGFTSDTVISLIRGTFSDIEPLVVFIFNLLGIYPLLFAVILSNRNSGGSPVWPFILLSFVLGAFALLPYFFLFSSKPKTSTKNNPLLEFICKILQSKTILFIIVIFFIANLFVLTRGFSLDGFMIAFYSSKLVNIMSVDLLLLLWLSYYSFKHLYGNKHAWLSFIPVVGPIMLLWKKKTH